MNGKYQESVVFRQPLQIEADNVIFICQNGIKRLQKICQFGRIGSWRICHDVEGIAEGEGADAGGVRQSRRRSRAHLCPL